MEFLSTSSDLALVAKYKKKGLLVDTNLLLLLLVGYFDLKKIDSYKRLQKYSETDYDWVFRFVQPFEVVFVTPQILAEVSNMLKVNDEDVKLVSAKIKEVVDDLKEKYFPKDVLTSDPLISKFGYADVSIINAARKNRALILTDDLPLTAELRVRGCDVFNLNDLRTIDWL